MEFILEAGSNLAVFHVSAGADEVAVKLLRAGLGQQMPARTETTTGLGREIAIA